MVLEKRKGGNIKLKTAPSTLREFKHLHTAASKTDVSPPTKACNAIIYITLTGQAKCVVQAPNKQTMKTCNTACTNTTITRLQNEFSARCRNHEFRQWPSLYTFDNGVYAMAPDADYNKITLTISFARHTFLRPRMPSKVSKPQNHFMAAPPAHALDSMCVETSKPFLSPGRLRQ